MQTFFKQILQFTHKSLIIKYVIQQDFLLALPEGYKMIHFKYTRARNHSPHLHIFSNQSPKEVSRHYKKKLPQPNLSHGRFLSFSFNQKIKGIIISLPNLTHGVLYLEHESDYLPNPYASLRLPLITWQLFLDKV